MLSEAPTTRVYAGTDRRATDPLNLLGRQWDRVCREAVAPGEIMVALEAAGLNDAIARDRYGCVDLLDVAERLYRQVPYRPRVEETPAPPAPTAWLPLLRGVTYLLPAAWLPITANLMPVESANTGWVTATLFCWGWGQLVAYFGYGALGRSLGGQAAMLVRLLSGLGVVLAVLVAAGVARLVQVPVAATATTALVTATYVFSAYALLVYGRALLLFVVSVPAAALGLALGLAPEGSVSPWVGPTVLAYAVLVPFALTVWTTRQPNLPHLPPASEALRAGGHALYGWCCAVFLAWATMTSAHVTTLSGLAGSIVLVPLVLSMGVMEAIVERLLGRLRALASLPLTFEGLIGRARTAILVGLAAYAASLVLLHVVMAVVTSTAVPLAHLVGQLLFGVAAMLSAVLVAVNRLWLVVASWAAALALLFALNVLPFGAAVGPSAVFLLDVEALLFGLAISMAVALYDINTYR